MLWLQAEASGFITLGSGHLQFELSVASVVFHAIWFNHFVLYVHMCVCECLLVLYIFYVVLEVSLPVTLSSSLKSPFVVQRNNKLIQFFSILPLMPYLNKK